MYYQNNINTHVSNNWPPDLPNHELGNVCFTCPPPPLPSFCGSNELTSIPLTHINKLEECFSESYVASTRSIQYPNSLSFKNLNSRNHITKQQPNKLPFTNINEELIFYAHCQLKLCLKVTCVKRDLIKCTSMMKEFERLVNLLQVFKKTLSEQDWSNRCKEIKSKEEDIKKLLSKYENPEYFLAVQRAVKKCIKKRTYRKRMKREWQEMKKVSKAFREREHRRIDLWLEKMKEQVEKTRREEQVKREADLVLSEVTAKKAEAKRFINLFNTLTKLRNARVQQVTSAGNFVSDSETRSFTQVIDKLKKLWIDQLKEYKIEEQGLRVMLNDAEVERVNVETKVTKQIQKKWSELFFGEGANKQFIVPNNMEELIAIRYEWDRFIVADNTCLSSKIPVGWIVPSEPSNTEWSKYLQK